MSFVHEEPASRQVPASIVAPAGTVTGQSVCVLGGKFVYEKGGHIPGVIGGGGEGGGEGGGGAVHSALLPL